MKQSSSSEYVFNVGTALGTNLIAPTPQIVYGSWPVCTVMSDGTGWQIFKDTLSPAPYDLFQTAPLSPTITINADKLLNDDALMSRLTAEMLKHFSSDKIVELAKEDLDQFEAPVAQKQGRRISRI